ncbi:MAG: LysR substrate-binding domain-containing protein [Pseudomonadota bacterium]|nr:LysR substrate-binding domain-containing protein [Pseudomonadota bacterium]
MTTRATSRNALCGWTVQRWEITFPNGPARPSGHRASREDQVIRNNRFPSIRSLRAFEAAARHMSFTLAAQELNLTQGAVSHQIRSLEELLEHPLFTREGNAIVLTETGRDYLVMARSVIAELRIATNEAIDRDSENSLTIGCLGTFSIKCLMPNLKSFMDAHPDFKVTVRTIGPSEKTAAQDCDVTIHYGHRSQWPSLTSHEITRETLFPVCSPAYLDAGPGLTQPADLMHYRLIETRSPLILRDDWLIWLKSAGVDDLDPPDRIICDLLFPSYQAAIEGIGVALGRSAVVKDDLVAGRLVEPFAIRTQTHLGYHLLLSPHRRPSAAVEAFQAWVLGPFKDAISD